MGIEFGPSALTTALTFIGSSGFGAALLYFLGRKRQNKLDEITIKTAEIKAVLDTRTADQKSIDQLMHRVEMLEGYREKDSLRIEQLHTNKIELEQKVGALQQEVAILQNRIDDYQQDEALYKAQIADLQQRLTSKNEELRCAVEALSALKQKEADRVFTLDENKGQSQQNGYGTNP